MKLYLNSYLTVLKKNFMLLLIVMVLLAVTFPIWIAIPFFIIASIVAKVTTSIAIVFIFVSLAVGFLFSLYFVPINWKVVNNLGKKNRPLSFMYLQTIFILISSLIFGIVLILINILK